MSTEPNRLFVPALAPLYRSGHDPVETLLRLVAGGFLVIHGAGKIVDPFGAVQMVEGLGFYPGIIWSPLLAATEFFGGILLAIGLLTRPADRPSGHGLFPLDPDGAGLLRRRKVSALGSDHPVLRDPRRQQPIRRRTPEEEFLISKDRGHPGALCLATSARPCFL